MGDLVPIEKAGPHEPVPVLQIRGIEVVLDQDLARVFDLETRVLNQRLKRNQDRFPDSWLFQLTKDEFENLKSRNVISRDGWGGRRTPPWALSEYGVVMAATLINTDIAVQASQHIVKSFVDLRSTGALVRLPGALTSPKLPALKQKLTEIMALQINPKTGASMREETDALISEGLASLKSRLAKAGLENQEIEARVLKHLADAEEARARAATEREMTEKQRLKNQANQLRMMIRAELAMQGGDLDEFLDLLDKMSD